MLVGKFDFNQEKSLPNGLGKKLGDRLGDTQQNILALMQNNPKISIIVLASELGISTTAIEKHIKTLKEQNIIKRIGGAKGGYWEKQTATVLVKEFEEKGILKEITGYERNKLFVFDKYLSIYSQS